MDKTNKTLLLYCFLASLWSSGLAAFGSPAHYDTRLTIAVACLIPLAVARYLEQQKETTK